MGRRPIGFHHLAELELAVVRPVLGHLQCHCQAVRALVAQLVHRLLGRVALRVEAGLVYPVPVGSIEAID